MTERSNNTGGSRPIWSRPLRRMGTVLLITTLCVLGYVWGLEMKRPSIVFALGYNLALMGFAFLIWLVVPLRLGDAYYRIRAWERSGRIYEILGVHFFQRLLRRTGLYTSHLVPGQIKGASGIRALLNATSPSETSHALIFLIVGALTIDVALSGWWDIAGWLTAFNVLLNAYPVMSLRLVRSRIHRLCLRSDGGGVRTLNGA